MKNKCGFCGKELEDKEIYGELTIKRNNVIRVKQRMKNYCLSCLQAIDWIKSYEKKKEKVLPESTEERGKKAIDKFF